MGRVDYFHDPNAPKANSLRPAVSAFVQDDQGRILMIRRTDNDKYAIPGGQQEVGETLSEAAIRETKEETGVEIEVKGLIGLYSNPRHIIAYDDGEIRQEFSICFRGSPIGGTLTSSSESKEVHWVDPKEINNLDIHPSILLRISHGLARTDRPFFT
ncbi:ADP-ribose pyrophosphatase YjhB (NUDIX family) [Saccharothrix coeruleofusca]|uniref:NUDIX hydrolase n=1 Tax=Saccharothrix coeruleofusca TaxID=33919 RepID=UPI001AE9A278|nr:NUDIX domain-containing protein [Saccharothrix coeruleofusca]MBP2340684.1 ADP-ribose pyrophosphatase YjhB (NUDIX family) [Saccharothrix coeruleofusca]